MTVAQQLDIELIERRDEIPLSAAQWNALLASNDTDSIFQTYEWFDAWWRAFGSAHQLFFLVLRHADEVRGFAPLMVSRGQWGLRELQFIGTGNADYLDFVIVGDRRAALLSICLFLRGHAARWDRIWLSNLPADSSSLAGLAQAATMSGLFTIEESRVRCPAMLLEQERSRVHQLINKYSIRRPLNWFQKRGTVSFRHVASIEDVSALLPAFFEQHIRRWRAAGKVSLFEQARQRDFYTSLAAAVHGPGWLLFSVLELDREPIAFHFGFDYGGSVTWYKPAFDMRHAEHSPGLLLIRQLIEDGLARHRKQIDFTIGEEQFKDRFANVQRSNVYLAVYHSRALWRGALCIRESRRLAGRTARWLRHWFKQAGVPDMLQRIQSLIAPLFSGAFWRSKQAEWQARRFDRRWQTDTFVRMPVAAMQGVPAALASHAVHYEGSSIPKLQRALKVLRRQLGASLAQHSFVDFGSGKGLAVMLASRLPFRVVYGVEMAPRLHAIAEANVSKFRAQHSDGAPISLTCGDALDFALPPGSLVAYLYNPFDAVLMRRCVTRLAAAAADGRELLIVYVNPVHREIFDGDSRFQPLFVDATLCVFRFTQADEKGGDA